MVRREFRGRRAFVAFHRARRWCDGVGLSVGSLCGPCPIGVLVGLFGIAKWRNLTAAERRRLDGRLVAPGGFRHGPVVLELKAAAARRLGLDGQGRRLRSGKRGAGHGKQ